MFNQSKPSPSNKVSAKVIPYIVGGLGNQLFIYAAARRLALINNAELVLDDVSGFTRDYVYQRHYQLDHFHISARKATPRERLEPFPRVRRYIYRRYSRRLPFDSRSYLQQESQDFDPRLLTLKFQGTLYLEGYWQSENYFKDVEATIRKDLCIIEPTDSSNQRMATKIRGSNSVALHIRFFTPIGQANDNSTNVNQEYYQGAISKIENLFSNPHYFIFSDQPDSVNKLIPLSDDRMTLVKHNKGDNNAYSDLWLMTLCRHFIIPNSTFAWWGAWLASHPQKVVISPITEAGGWNKKGLIPSSWLSL
jgi:hypothetical protein